jgi:hypothetical protein
MNPINCPSDVKRAGAEWIAGTAGHEPRQIGLAINHFRRWRPVWPFGLAVDVFEAVPFETLRDQHRCRNEGRGYCLVQYKGTALAY